MSDVKMQALDTLFISSVSSENIPPKGEFEVSEDQAARLEAAGLATRVGAKAAPAPANKAKLSPTNKAKPTLAEKVKPAAKKVLG